MADRHQLGTDARRRRDREIRMLGILVSVAAHVLVFAGWRGVSFPLSPFAAAGPRTGDARAAAGDGGGGGMEVLALRIAPAAPLVPPLLPLPTLVEMEPVPVEAAAVDAGDLLSRAPGLEAPGAGASGIPGGTGTGDGGTGAEGRFRLVPPTPRGMIVPPANGRLKGRSVEVWVFVDERGRVVADSTRLRPPTSDGDFNRRLIREAAEWRFEPGKQGGQPVATWFPYTISME